MYLLNHIKQIVNSERLTSDAKVVAMRKIIKLAGDNSPYYRREAADLLAAIRIDREMFPMEFVYWQGVKEHL